MSLHAPIILLKDGTEQQHGKGQILSNIGACQTVSEMVRTTLGPRGMDKLIYGDNSVTITNDGATVMSLLDIVHPAAKLLVDIAQSQDDEVGDGTTSVTILAGEFLAEARQFIEDGIHPQVVIRGYYTALKHALDRMKELRIDLENKPLSEKQDFLRRCAETSLNSKLVAGYREFFSDMIVKAVGMLDDKLDRELIGIKKVTGGSVTDSILIDGVAFKKCFSYAGFEQQPKHFMNPKVLLLNLELELKAEKENAEIRVSSPEEYQAVVDAEWKIIFEKLDNIVQSGAQVVLSRLPIGDLATQYFADRNVFCAGRLDEGDLKRTSRATAANVQTTVNNLKPTDLGTCGEFEEIQVGNERFNIFRKCEATKSATFILRGGAQQFIDEAERSLHDAIMIVKRVMQNSTVVGGGGAIEMLLSSHIREQSHLIEGKQQLIVAAFARALEIIPRTLASNSGLDSTEIMTKLRQKHSFGKGEQWKWYGVNCFEGGVCDASEKFVWEPSLVKENALASATEAACLVLSIDETVRNPKSNPEPNGPNAQQAITGQARRPMPRR